MVGELGVGSLGDRLSALCVSDSSKDSILHVIKAVEDAGDAIKLQLEENRQLNDEILEKNQELENYKSVVEKSSRASAGVPRDEHIPGPFTSNQVSPGNHHYSNSIRGNGTLKVHSRGQAKVSIPVGSRNLPASSRSLSPSRQWKEREYDPRINSSDHEVLQAHEINISSRLTSQWKHDLVRKVQENEEEISQLRRHLANYSLKEAQIRNEKSVLENHIAHMRMAFDEQQKDLVYAASRALSFREEVIEENIHLIHALQEAQQDRSTYVSSLLPLLAEYGVQPPGPDALSIVSNLKVLFKHLHEKFIIVEEKLKESQFQMAPLRTEASNTTNFVPQSPSHFYGVTQTTTRADWEALKPQTSSGGTAKNVVHDNMGRSSPSINRNSVPEEIPGKVAVTRDDSQAVPFRAETKEKTLSFKDLVRGNEMDDLEASVLHHGRESTFQWGSETSPYTGSGLDQTSSYSGYLPPVLEEPSSSFSEAAEDDPWPAIEGLQISGEAFPGRELQACGQSINGTISCIFNWVRHLEDGSVNYIEGAKQPGYLVTVDDVDSYLAIEVQPLDNRNRRGELVKVFANEQKKIAYDPQMQEQIQRTLSIGRASFEVSISAGVLNIWEHASLIIKRGGYSIKCDGPRGVITEKFSANTKISVPYGKATEFLIQNAGGDEHLLSAESSSSLRDTIVLIMRLFKKRVTFHLSFVILLNHLLYLWIIYLSINVLVCHVIAMIETCVVAKFLAICTCLLMGTE